MQTNAHKVYRAHAFGWRRFISGAAAFFALSLMATPAYAFVPEYTLGAGAQYRSPQEARGFVLGEMDVLDYLGVRVEAALGASHDTLKGVVWAGPTLSLDIATWAPALFLGIGYRGGPSALAGTARAELRRYVNLHSAIGLGVGAEWAQREDTQLSAALGYFHRF